MYWKSLELHSFMFPNQFLKKVNMTSNGILKFLKISRKDVTNE